MVYYFYYRDPAQEGSRRVAVSCRKKVIEKHRSVFKGYGYTVSSVFKGDFHSFSLG